MVGLSLPDFIAQRTRWGIIELHDLQLATKETERLGLVDWFKALDIYTCREGPQWVDLFWERSSKTVKDKLWADSGYTYSLLFGSLFFFYTTRDQDWVCEYPTMWDNPLFKNHDSGTTS